MYKGLQFKKPPYISSSKTKEEKVISNVCPLLWIQQRPQGLQKRYCWMDQTRHYTCLSSSEPGTAKVDHSPFYQSLGIFVCGEKRGSYTIRSAGHALKPFFRHCRINLVSSQDHFFSRKVLLGCWPSLSTYCQSSQMLPWKITWEKKLGTWYFHFMGIFQGSTDAQPWIAWGLKRMPIWVCCTHVVPSVLLQYWGTEVSNFFYNGGWCVSCFSGVGEPSLKLTFFFFFSPRHTPVYTRHMPYSLRHSLESYMKNKPPKLVESPHTTSTRF